MNTYSAERANIEKDEERDSRIDKAFLRFHERSMPKIDEFRGVDGYSDKEIDEKKKKLSVHDSVFLRESEERQEELDENNNNRAKLCTVIRMMVAEDGGESFLTGRKSHIDVASRYDQLYNGTTLVYRMEDLDGSKPYDISLDVTTIDFNHNIEGMFSDKSYGAGIVKEVSFVKHGEKKKKVKNAPSFVVGISEDNLEEALDGYSIVSHEKNDGTTDTKLESEGPNLDIKFKILSEMFEQTEMRLGQIERSKPLTDSVIAAKTKYTAIKSRLRNEIALMFDLNVRNIDNSEKLALFNERFEREYGEKMQSLRKEDKIYDEIIRLSKNIKTGSMVHNVMRDEKRMGDTLVRPSKLTFRR